MPNISMLKKFQRTIKRLLFEDESGLEKEFRKADQIEDWTVIDIQADHIILRQEPEKEWLMENQVILRMPSQHIIMEDGAMPKK